MNIQRSIMLVILVCVAHASRAGELSDNIRISSTHLGYDLQYRVYSPDGVTTGRKYPVLMVTDGQWYIQPGGMVAVLDELISAGRIGPVYVVFVDSRNPDKLRQNRRNDEFMCNADYVNFFTAELLPTLYEQYPINVDRLDINILGLSFGGLNAACFGVLASNRFHGIGMHSPAATKHVGIVADLYEKNEVMPLRVFISAGTVNDNLRAARKLRDVLEEKGFDVTYVENKGKSHNWENWGELIDDVLLALLGPDAS